MASTVKSFNPTKHLKEQFVSNLSGSSMMELFVLMSTLAIVVLVRRAFDSKKFIGPESNAAARKKNDDPHVGHKSFMDYIGRIIVDFFTIPVPLILLLTVLSEWLYAVAILLSISLLISLSFKRFGTSVFQDDTALSLREHVSCYRVCMVLVTCLCILAVDFKIFPRRYAKTETYGTGLMDLGVGSFVFANAIVSRQARGSSIVTLGSAVRSCSPLIFLGFARLLFTSGVDYQVHVGEYGVHWNFFFTLAAVAIATSIVNITPKYCGVVGFLILVGYQISLLRGLNKYLLSDTRGTDIISQNKEGIFSILGYWGLYLVGVQLGNHLLFENHAVTTHKSKRIARIRVWSLCIFFWSLTLFLDWQVERVSRRMCNLAYVALVVAVNLQVLAIFILSDYIPGSKISFLEEAFNRNLLASFLLANVLTGLVNLSMDTLFMSQSSALAIMLLYTFILCVCVGSAYSYNIKLKFW